MNFIGLYNWKSTFPGGWGGVVGKLGNKANLRSFGLDLKVWQHCHCQVSEKHLLFLLKVVDTVKGNLITIVVFGVVGTTITIVIGITGR